MSQLYTYYRVQETNKIGCTIDLEHRRTSSFLGNTSYDAQGYNIDVLIQIMFPNDECAGEYEKRLQTLYQSRNDNVKYAQSIKNLVSAGKIAGKKAVESGQFKEFTKAGGRVAGRQNGKIAGKKAVESGQLKSIRTSENQAKWVKAGGAATGRLNWFNNGTKNIRAVQCPDGFSAGMFKK